MEDTFGLSKALDENVSNERTEPDNDDYETKMSKTHEGKGKEKQTTPGLKGGMDAGEVRRIMAEKLRQQIEKS